jgi:hypothetical protein
MSFETDTLCVVAPLDPYEGDHYNELVDEDVWSLRVENIYKVTGHREDYINPTIDGELSWRSVKYYDTDSEDALDRWKISFMRCQQGGVHISQIEECVEDFGSYQYDGSELVDILIAWIQHIPEYQRFHTLDTVLVNILA